jgi:NAD(P)-dependent dehydrogenase (short-subunit alcohol dehydrogenase family)
MTKPLDKPLSGKIAVVAGATRGAGRGIACMLGEAGATVYCTGRSTRNKYIKPNADTPFDLSARRETIEETAEMVTKYGGVGIPVQVDHLVEDQVKGLFDRVRAEHSKLDILVNDVWGSEHYVEWGKAFWELDVNKGFEMISAALFTHIITSRYAVPLMVERGQGLVVEIGDGDTLDYRGQFFYDIVKTTVIRIAFALSKELQPKGITALAVTPGFLRSEAMLEHFGVTEENWRDGAKTDPYFISSETPFYVGRAIAALSADPKVIEKSGKAFSSWGLMEEYGFTDINGEQPNWGKYFK